ncbi:hypothetical protein PFAG_01592 [Plasmodium falciparum Santa Lucia]|uniref:CHCH domain-containing protein n=9 Tax=Plasmodium falciparum TaxID=5833 RepID=A0A143ZVJ1_PLAF7|nr:conserved protein, unknown function [Plasmodium falciparum 3D7]ETW19462.1 hypothetical protein PFFVO_01639 [Plasmodium falciparum Vietnam Oak-Knoll (FVO)]ETW37540.1 hypothetical protein PFTANZ_01722 [Plasmodium falciparum Tanzania (2000708)]ETW43835.1 hypothetical protein PFNF135_01765 [Plasmodium falciparum NF135/5.C10]ETW62463.1 hypothetical protein PFMC_01651 [Plasmodium falciparum CAMP/Malaysia]EUR74058.1 hypothetical protein PFBG_01655 [Plasmodium falciparum 7G8]EUT88751.1 hypothetica|eukprot:XP_024329039.1 conserved Plasmodium protein, unknown function [Plasmodium falciparum 3D7]
MLSHLHNSISVSSFFKSDIKDEDVDDKIEQTKCAAQYNVLLECLDKNDRNWVKCQEPLKIFKNCYNENNKNNNNNKN